MFVCLFVYVTLRFIYLFIYLFSFYIELLNILLIQLSDEFNWSKDLYLSKLFLHCLNIIWTFNSIPSFTNGHRVETQTVQLVIIIPYLYSTFFIPYIRSIVLYILTKKNPVSRITIFHEITQYVRANFYAVNTYGTSMVLFRYDLTQWDRVNNIILNTNHTFKNILF